MAVATLELYSPHAMQLKFHNSRARYRVAAWGRQAGKSTACLNELLKRAWENPNTKLWFLSPTFDQAKTQYRRLVGMLWPVNNILLKKNQTELRVKLINQSEIVFKSGESLENLRGATLHGVVIDEVREQNPNLWKMILRPMLATTKGWAAFVSTPNGFDAFYDLAQTAMHDDSNEWEFFQAPSTCNPLFTQEEFNAAKKDMGEAEFAQEILAEFRDLHQGSAYMNFSDANVREQNPFAPQGQSLQPYLPVHLYCDWNVSPMGWVMAQSRNELGTYVFDEIFIKKTHTEQCAQEFIARFQSLDIKANPKVVIVGDSTGKANKTSAGGQTDFSILTGALDTAGITWVNLTPESNPNVKDRVNTVNARLKSADNQHYLWVSPHCKELIKDFQRVSWKKGASAILDQTSDPDRTHLSDALGYGVCVTNPIKPVNQVGTLRMIRR